MNNNEAVLLPTGDFLRQLVGQSKVKSGELKSILRARGVFTGTDEKDVTGPILIKTGLSPYEYLELRESYKSKEESRKTKTRTIKWDSETPLVEAIPDIIDYEALLNDQFGVYSISSTSEFTALEGNPDHLYMDFSIQRDDAIKNWGENRSEHRGQVEIKKAGDGQSLAISLTHTAPETQTFANKVSNSLVRHFKDQGHIEQEEVIKIIRFADFTNEGRVKFLNALTQSPKHTDLEFVDAVDIQFSPDHESGNPPERIQWMKDKIEDLKMKGKSLQSTFFVHDSEYYPFVKLFRVQCNYKFDTGDYSGTCRVLFEFSDRDESSGSELILNMSLLRLESNTTGESKEHLKKKILNSLEQYKMEAFDEFRNQVS